MIRVDGELVGACVARVGWRKGAQLAEFLSAWAIAEAELEHEVGIEEFSTWWSSSRRTAYNRMTLFREAFPEADSPGDVVRARVTPLARAHSRVAI